MHEIPSVPTVRTTGDQIVIGQFRSDEPAVRQLVDTRGDDAPAAVVEAIAVGARQLQLTSSHADVAALEQRIDQLTHTLGDLGDGWTDQLRTRLDELTGRLGQDLAARQQQTVATLDRELARRLDPDQAVWVRQLLGSLSQGLAEQLKQQTSLLTAGLKAQIGLSGTDSPLGQISTQLGDLHTAVARLVADLAADQARAEEAAHGTRKGLAFEQAAHQLLAEAAGDGLVDDVSREPGAGGGKQGDLLWHLTDPVGRNLRVAIELKDVSKPWTGNAARKILTDAATNRDAHGAILAVPDTATTPGGQPLVILDGDLPAVIVSLDDPIAVKVALRYLRAVVLTTAARSSNDSLDTARLQDLLGRIRTELAKFTQLRRHLTTADKALDSSRDIADSLHTTIDQLLDQAVAELRPTDTAPHAA